MKKYALAAMFVAAVPVSVAHAQTAPDASVPTDTAAAPADPSASTTPAATPARTGGAPDGTPAFGIEPYLGIMGGYEDFDHDGKSPLTTGCSRTSCAQGALIEGVGGINVPLGPLFVGAEGSVAKGFDGLRWEYGAFGRVGFRAGDSGMIYAKGGHEWVHTHRQGNDDDWEYGMGVEVGPKSIGLGGLTGNSGARLRLEATTYNLRSIRPTAGVVFHF